MDRTEEIITYLRIPMEERFFLSCQEIQVLYNTQYGQIWEYLENIFTALFTKTIQAQAKGRKGPVGFLAIEYLHSSLHTGRWGYRIETFDKELYLNENETEKYFYPQFLYECWERDIGFFCSCIKEEYPRIQAYEREEIRTCYIANYNALIKKLFKELIPKIFKIPLWEEVVKEKAVKVIFGEYMAAEEIIEMEENTNE